MTTPQEALLAFEERLNELRNQSVAEAFHEIVAAVRTALLQQEKEAENPQSVALFCDLKTDEEKANFFLSGRGYETGVIARAIQNDVAMAYHRCAEYRKEATRKHLAKGGK